MLSAMCRTGGDDIVRRLVVFPQIVQSLKFLATMGSPRAKKKAASILRQINLHRDRQQTAVEAI